MHMPAIHDLPTAEVAAEARTALQQLSALAGATRSARPVALRVREGRREAVVTIPRQALELFLEILGQMANGNAVTIHPVQAELTTQQAADLLNVSRPFVVRLLEEGAIPYRRVGTHRRVLAADVLAYQRQDEARRAQVLDELAADAQRNRLGY